MNECVRMCQKCVLSNSDLFCGRVCLYSIRKKCSKKNILHNFPAITLRDTKRFSASHRLCILCKDREALSTVPQIERIKALKTARIYIPAGARVCANHREVPSWEAVSHMAEFEEFKQSHIEDMLTLTLASGDVQAEPPAIDIKRNTGLSEHQFDDLFSRSPSLVREMRNVRNAKNALLMYLMRQRKAATYDTIGERFGISRIKASMDIEKVRQVLTAEFVPQFLGFQNLDRDFLLENTTISARMLHCNNNPKVHQYIFWTAITTLN